MVVRQQIKKVLIGAAMAGRVLPFGSHLLPEIKRRLPKFRVDLIFDIGANGGQTIKEYRPWFPKATIVCFEPDPTTYDRLKAAVRRDALVQTYNIALAEKPGRLRFDNRSPVTEIRAIARDQSDEALPWVEVSTVDRYCAERTIGRIDLLKIDTEGHDLHVIRGAADMLDRAAIGILIAECSFADSARLVQFPNIHSEMLSRGYRLFGVYQQMPGYNTGASFISWANCAYVSPAIIKAHA